MIVFFVQCYKNESLVIFHHFLFSTLFETSLLLSILIYSFLFEPSSIVFNYSSISPNYFPYFLLLIFLFPFFLIYFYCFSFQFFYLSFLSHLFFCFRHLFFSYYFYHIVTSTDTDSPFASLNKGCFS